jgi:hypothetical protein
VRAHDCVKMTEKQLVRTGNQTCEELLRDHSPETMKDLPLEDLNDLLVHHSLQDLASFCHTFRTQFENNVMLIALSSSYIQYPANKTINIAGSRKVVYPLDKRNYIFVDGEDVDNIRNFGEKEQSLFIKQFEGAFYNIRLPVGVNTKKRRVVDYDDDDGGGTTRHLHKENVRLNVELAVKEKELEFMKEKYEMEKKMFDYKVRVQEEINRLLVSQQQQQQPLLLQQQQPLLLQQQHQQHHQHQQIHPKLLTMDTIPDRMTTVSGWIGENKYGQDLENRVVHNIQKWADVFNNPEITPDMLYSKLKVDIGDKCRLVVPLTYSYSLLKVLMLLDMNNGKTEVLVKACSHSYMITLYATDESVVPRDTANYNRWLNAITIATHAHFMMASCYANKTEQFDDGGDDDDDDGGGGNGAKKKNRKKYVTCLNQRNRPPRMVSNYDIMDEYFPSTVYFGSNTSMCIGMGLHCKEVKNTTAKKPRKKKTKVTKSGGGGGTAANGAKADGVGTGNGKTCPLCQVPEKTLKPNKKEHRFSHQPRNCNLLATLSNNEVDILLTIMKLCRCVEKEDAKSTRSIKRNKYIFGIPLKTSEPDRMVIEHGTLLRHATPQEIVSGQHVNGLRIQKSIFNTLRKNVYQTLKLQFEGSVFEALEIHVASMVSNLEGMPFPIPPVKDLIYDSNGSLLVDPTTRKMSKDFNADTLYFSFDAQPQSDRTTIYMNTVELEKQMQHHFIKNFHYDVSPASNNNNNNNNYDHNQHNNHQYDTFHQHQQPLTQFNDMYHIPNFAFQLGDFNSFVPQFSVDNHNQFQPFVFNPNNV